MNIDMTGEPSAVASQPILVVDDDPRNRKLLQRILASGGFGARTAEDGETALRAVHDEPPALVLLDCMMPGIDGFEVCRRLKTDPDTRALPVLLVTALGGACEVRGLDAGADDYVTKPVDRESLLARIRTHLRIKKLRDELVESRETLAVQNRKLSEVEELRHDLVHMMIHDLKSPLNALDISVELLREELHEALSDNAQMALRNIDECSVRLGFITRNILDVARLERAEMELETSEIAARELVQSMLRSSAVVAQHRAVDIVVDIADGVPEFRADSELIGRVLENLVGNALKVTDPGGAVAIRVTSEPPDSIVLSVDDRGPGVPVADRALIFDKFARRKLRNSPAASANHGLGLSFCKLAIEAHGGAVWVEDHLGGGSRFRFRLPLIGPTSAATQFHTLASSSVSGRCY